MRYAHRFMLLAIVVLLVGCNPPVEPEVAETQDLVPADGDQALEWLLAGNERFVAGTPRHDHESAKRRAMLADGQHPFAVVLGCADSRVPPELLFDHGIGDLFVIRVAGNVVAEDEAGSIEYAMAHLHTPLIVVLGHEGCGAVTAALGVFDEEPEELVTLLRRIRPALDDVDRTLPVEQQVASGVQANVRHAVAQLRSIVQREDRPHEMRSKIVGAVYDLDTGRVEVLED